MVSALIRACLSMKLLVILLAAVVAVLGFRALENNPKDAIPDISENQVIVSAEWMGRSPRDVEDQITYPLSVALQGIPQVREIRTISGFGFSRVYVIFHDGVEVYWARTRVLERLAVAGVGLPAGVVPSLGPDATPLGQVFWYTVDGPLDLSELRSIQDYVVRYALQSVEGVSEVASIGGMVREYQIEVDPEVLRAHGIPIGHLEMAVRESNLDVGAMTVEKSAVEFMVRGVGFIRTIEDIEQIVVARAGHSPVLLRDIARVQLGPAFRRGALADHQRERVGGVVTVRYGANPLTVIAGIRQAIAALEPTLPSGVTISSFYDRTELIEETLETLSDTLLMEIAIVVVVVMLFLLHLRSALIVSATIPLAVLLAFIGMQAFGVDSNIMSLAGIAIAIGAVVDYGIIMTESVYRGLEEDGGRNPRTSVVHGAASEVGGAILTAATTTILGFLPVFFLTGQSYRLFAPLAYTKSFVMLAAAIIGITLIPVLCHMFLGGGRRPQTRAARAFHEAMGWIGPLGIAALVAWMLVKHRSFLSVPEGWSSTLVAIAGFVVTAALLLRMARERLTPFDDNLPARAIVWVYRHILGFLLVRKWVIAVVFLAITLMGAFVLVGARTALKPVTAAFEWLGGDASRIPAVAAMDEHFPGIGSEFMPPLDEGSLLFMPSLLMQGSINEALRVMEWQNKQITGVPEVLSAVGKLGRAETALDPAPAGMIETIVLLKPKSEWRPGIHKADIIRELRQATNLPGVAPSWLQPIETRIVMLSSGIRAKIGLEIAGDNVDKLYELTVALEPIVREVPGATDVVALRTGGAPYVEFRLRRDRMAHYGVSVMQVQDIIETALGGRALTTTVEGRERYPVRIRYERELRDNLEDLGGILVTAENGAQIPISDVADIEYVVGPASIRGVNGRLVGYVMFNTVDIDETTLIGRVEERIAKAREAGEVDWPAGYTPRWVGQYQEQQRARDRLLYIIPLTLTLILLLVYMHFRRLSTALLVLTGVPLGVAGGFLLLHYWPAIEAAISGEPQGPPIYLTVAVVVGFIALAGIVIDDGVVIATYIMQREERDKPGDIDAIRAVVLEAGSRRIRPTLMTTITTFIALVPVVLATGRGSDVMAPMALPILGGMIVELLTLFVVPVAMCSMMEWKHRIKEVFTSSEDRH